jgi:hypothetical protein
MNEEFFILRSLYNKHGHRNQVLKLAEEASELSRACVKMVMQMHDTPDHEIDKSNWIEEIVDVQILIEQFMTFYSGAEILEQRKARFEKLKNYVKESGHDTFV